MIKTCPSCGESSSLRDVFYGLPDGPLDGTKYVTGGCCISESNPMINCIDCGWEGNFTSWIKRTDF